MGSFIRILLVLLYKNFLVLRKQWISTIFKAFLIPVFLIVLGWATVAFVLSIKVSPEDHGIIYPPEPAVDPYFSIQDFYFAPDNNFTRELVNSSGHCLHVTSSNYHGFSTEEELINSLSENIGRESIIVIFDKNMDYSKKNLNYKIRSKNVNNLKQYDLEYLIEGKYLTDNFMQVQTCVDVSFIKMKADSTVEEPKIFFERMPEPRRMNLKKLTDFMIIEFWCLIMFALMIPVMSIVADAANEKFLGINVLMSMNGVSNASSLLSWLVSGVIYITIFCTLPLMIGLSMSKFYASHHDMIFFMHRSNMFLFWTAFTIHIAHSVAFSLHVSAYFSKSLFVTLSLFIINAVSAAIPQYILVGNSSVFIPYLGVIFPNLLLLQIVQETTLYESLEQGIQFNNMFQVQKSAYGFAGNFGMAVAFTIMGIFIHLLLTIYIYEIHPGKYGVAKPVFFFLKRKVKKGEGRNNVIDPKFNDVDKGVLFEQTLGDIHEPGIQIRNLRKTYKVGLFNQSEVQALRGVSVDFHKGQITALLGHNGAGKTTMMSILSGMTSPSHGAVFVNSKDVSEDTNEILRDMGLCTQENMVFPNLTVYQQLLIFSMLKNNGKSKSSNEQRVKVLLQDLKLYDKRHCLANKLSGGQKRRLCLSVALVGEGNVIILDEPTSGLDPENKRLIWDVVLKMREQRTILISTHDMEEADILGDRIAIMHAGQLRGCGTSMFLKRIIGHGNVEVTLSMEPWCDMNNVCGELNNQVKIVNESSGKIVLCLPNTPDLPDSLDKLELKKKELGITGLSVSLISLEQVFLRVTQDEDDPSKVLQNLPMARRSSPEPSFLQQFYGLLIKNATYFVKNFSLFLIMLTLVCIATVAMYYLLKTLIIEEEPGKVIPINLGIYSDPQTFYTSPDDNLGQKYEQVVARSGNKARKIHNITLDDALMEIGRKDINSYHHYVIAAANFTKTAEGGLSGIALHSSSASFSWPISLNLLTNAILKSLTGDDYSISLTSHQLPYRSAGYYPDMPKIVSLSLTIAIIYLVYIMVALIVIHPVRETSTTVKQLQRMTGASCFTYWGSMMVFDMAIFLFVTTLIIAAFVGFDISLGLHMFGLNELCILISLFALFAINVLPMVYGFSFFNLTASSTVRLLFYLSIGAVLLPYLLDPLFDYVFRQHLDFSYNTLKTIKKVKDHLFLLVPHSSFYKSQGAFYNVAMRNSRCIRLPRDVCSSYTRDECCKLNCSDGKCDKYFGFFDGDTDEGRDLTKAMIYLCLTPIIYFGILTILENQLIQRLMAGQKIAVPEQHIDQQVKSEKSLVARKINTLISGNPNRVNISVRDGRENPSRHENSHVFLVYELQKRYGRLLAVKDVSFRVNERECFGLLGVNGAGKSTTFRMMTGGEVPDNGSMYINDRDFSKHRGYALSQVGYCPQNDAIIRSLNSYDHLRLFARLRGVPESQVEKEVDLWIQRLNLIACASQPSGTYSGGNKRRLNIAMALIGNPSLILLDEPTTGVDPGARRSLWNVIQLCQKAGQAVILTSHSMEECEVLCNRLGIMVDGRFVCMGSTQELKQRFGSGYDIEIKMHPQELNGHLSGIKRDIISSLNCKLIDEHSNYLMFHVEPTNMTWRKMYDVMNAIKNTYDSIDDFTITSSTLEQLFLLFAKEAQNKFSQSRS
ncbi:hypothetical protein QAD02_022120 [Eretmocerus hayati]|uniref:Uncharacterized protein n=1 Tax=Eretmocerus hayati TaxID=131215 RepID=A0ACC2PTP8_9HYME|nr:hypothetical protein QAD02_022120 [Eretmocerus hayati]